MRLVTLKILTSLAVVKSVSASSMMWKHKDAVTMQNSQEEPWENTMPCTHSRFFGSRECRSQEFGASATLSSPSDNRKRVKWTSSTKSVEQIEEEKIIFQDLMKSWLDSLVSGDPQSVTPDKLCEFLDAICEYKMRRHVRATTRSRFKDLRDSFQYYWYRRAWNTKGQRTFWSQLRIKLKFYQNPDVFKTPKCTAMILDQIYEKTSKFVAKMRKAREELKRRRNPALRQAQDPYVANQIMQFYFELSHFATLSKHRDIWKDFVNELSYCQNFKSAAIKDAVDKIMRLKRVRLTKSTTKRLRRSLCDLIDHSAHEAPSDDKLITKELMAIVDCIQTTTRVMKRSDTKSGTRPNPRTVKRRRKHDANSLVILNATLYQALVSAPKGSGEKTYVLQPELLYKLLKDLFTHESALEHKLGDFTSKCGSTQDLRVRILQNHEFICNDRSVVRKLTAALKDIPKATTDVVFEEVCKILDESLPPLNREQRILEA